MSLRAPADWLATVAAGDTVLVCSHALGKYETSIGTVDRTTKAAIWVRRPRATEATRYDRRRGEQVGAARFYGSYIMPATAEDVERLRLAVRHQQLVYTLGKRYPLHKQPLAVLESIGKLLQQHGVRDDS